jgi:hypothetical protein
MARPSNQSGEWEYQVKQMRLTNPLSGKPSRFFANIRTDTQEELGITSEAYGIVQNSELMEVALAALHGHGLKGYEMNVIVADNGARVFIEFTFKNKLLAKAVGDKFGFRFIIKNSFDRTLRVAVELAFLRLACTNGMSTLEKDFCDSRKHSKKSFDQEEKKSIKLDFMKEALEEAIKRGPDALKIYERLAEKSINDEKGLIVLKNIEEKGWLSTSLRESIETLWLRPNRPEDKARNLYNLYNAITEHLSHKVRGERYEYSEKLAHGILQLLVTAATKKDAFDKLITVPETNKIIMVPSAPILG